MAVAKVGDNYIGTYRRLKMLRQGKSCQIWEALRDLDQTRCVLKVLRDSHRDDREEIGLLKHEFSVGRELDHKNCIRIFEFDIARGVPFLALEYFMNSMNLKQWIRSDAYQLQVLPKIIEQMALGIQHLHEHGWIHRDLKPDNFLIDDQHTIKLIDYAIAQKIKRGIGRLLGGRGKVQGTRSYMSPEQIRNETLDPTADVYSLGCVLFELVSGKPPFTGENADDLLQRHLKTPVPSLLASNNSINSKLSDLVGRMMAKRKEERPQSMAEFLALFRELRMPMGRTSSP